jgi:hypothetical protein
MITTQNASYQNTWDGTVPDKQQSTEMYGTAAIYGLVTPVPYPISGDSITNEYFAPLDNSNYGFSMMPQQAPYTPSEPTGAMQLDTTGWNCDMLPPQFMTETPDQYWMPTNTLPMDYPMPYNQVLMNFGQQNSTDLTAPPTPEALPIQQFDESNDEVLELLAKPSGDDLVGMGLYDAPEEVALGGDLLGGMNPSLLISGKGLKLEETFSPAPVPEEDDEEADAEDDDDMGEEEKGDCLEQKQPRPSDAQDVQPSTLDGHSFYFEEDDYDYE